MAAAYPFPAFSAAELDSAFNALSPVLERLSPRTVVQSYPASQIIAALQSLFDSLANEQAEANRLNLWSLTGLKRDELRNAQALRGLWMTELGGAASRRFLTAFLNAAIKEIDWEAELKAGYRVSTEINPLGNQSDRIDLIVETAFSTVGVEVKIDARLGVRQLERYAAAIQTRARWRHTRPHIVLLAPFASDLTGVSSVPWTAVSDAADSVAESRPGRRSLVEQLIVSFGDHVRTF